ncbi:MAG: MFS transporter [Nitriliruptoraceae bacterium]
MSRPLRVRFDEIFRPGGDGRVFYGWRIVGAGALLQLLRSTMFLQAYGAYVVLLQEDFGWSVTLLSAGFAMARTESAVLGPIQGHLIDRFGPRAIMHVGVLLFGTGFVLLSIIRVPWHFFAAIFFIAVGSNFSGNLSISVAIVHWFDRRRSTALGFASTGFALGGIAVPLLVLALSAFGWRATALASGVFMLVIGPLVANVFRHRPAELGLTVDGVVAAPSAGRADEVSGALATSSTDSASMEATSFTARQAMRTGAFWRMSGAHALAVMLVNAVLVHLVPHLTRSFGYSLAEASLAVALMTILQFLGMVLGGVVGDRVNKQRLIWVCMVMHAVAALVLAFAVTPALVVVFALLHGTAWGVRGPVLRAWRADVFGTANFGSIMGYSSLIIMLGAATGPIIAGILYDMLGSYTTTFVLLSVCAVAGAALFASVRRPDPATVSPAM